MACLFFQLVGCTIIATIIQKRSFCCWMKSSMISIICIKYINYISKLQKDCAHAIHKARTAKPNLYNFCLIFTIFRRTCMFIAKDLQWRRGGALLSFWSWGIWKFSLCWPFLLFSNLNCITDLLYPFIARVCDSSIALLPPCAWFPLYLILTPCMMKNVIMHKHFISSLKPYPIYLGFAFWVLLFILTLFNLKPCFQ